MVRVVRHDDAGAMTTNIQPGSVIVAVDGSEHADLALRWATEQAWLERRPLALLTATGLPTVPIGTWGGVASGYAYPSEELLEEAHTVARHAQAIAEGLRPGVEAHAHAVLGDARQVLLDASRDAHLVVLGSRGRGPISSRLLGSVSASVSRDAACPVVVCRPGVDDQPEPDQGVLVGADGTPESLPVIEFALAYAAARDLPVTVMHTFIDQLTGVLGPGEVSRAEVGHEEQWLLLSESLAGLAEKYPDVDIRKVLARGFVEDRLSTGSERWDLVVVGRHPVDTIARFVSGAVATYVVEHARGTVAVVPQPKAVR